MNDISFDFTGRTAVFSGASGGLGLETAKLFHQAGANLVLGDLSVEGLAERVTEGGEGADRIVCRDLDVTSSASNRELVAAANEAFGGIDFVVPFAGIFRNQPATEISDDDWHATMSVNLDGVFYLLREALPSMREGGAIVNIASFAGHRGALQNVPYAASKGAIVTLTRSFAWEAAPLGVRVNGISPGLIETPMAAVSGSGGRSAEVVAQTPLARTGRPSEVASVIAFLCTSAASFVHGEILHINGGFHMG